MSWERRKFTLKIEELDSMQDSGNLRDELKNERCEFNLRNDDLIHRVY